MMAAAYVFVGACTLVVAAVLAADAGVLFLAVLVSGACMLGPRWT